MAPPSEIPALKMLRDYRRRLLHIGDVGEYSVASVDEVIAALAASSRTGEAPEEGIATTTFSMRTMAGAANAGMGRPSAYETNDRATRTKTGETPSIRKEPLAEATSITPLAPPTPPPAPTNWQPIASAPKDDGWFLVGSAGRVHISCRLNGQIRDLGCDPDTGDVGLYDPAFYQVTHWMPLPEPPKEK